MKITAWQITQINIAQVSTMQQKFCPVYECSAGNCCLQFETPGYEGNISTKEEEIFGENREEVLSSYDCFPSPSSRLNADFVVSWFLCRCAAVDIL